MASFLLEVSQRSLCEVPDDAGLPAGALSWSLYPYKRRKSQYTHKKNDIYFM
jgi:hypothetical protein